VCCFEADKSVDDIDDGEVSSVTARGIVDILERDNKSLVQRSRELEKQLHILRAAGSRMPPSNALSVYISSLYGLCIICLLSFSFMLKMIQYHLAEILFQISLNVVVAV